MPLCVILGAGEENMTGSSFVSSTRVKAAAGLAIAVLILVSAGKATAAPPANSNQLSSMLGELWTTTLGLPNSGPFNGGESCVYLPDGQLADWFSAPCTVQ